jgi:hypothetical protein
VLQAKGVPVTVAERGQRLVLGRGALVEVLHPGPEPMRGTGSDDNNNSVVLRLRWGRACFLLTGDIEEKAERLLASSYADLSCAVLKVAHHGSKTSTTQTFLEAVRRHVVEGLPYRKAARVRTIEAIGGDPSFAAALYLLHQSVLEGQHHVLGQARCPLLFHHQPALRRSLQGGDVGFAGRQIAE